MVAEKGLLGIGMQCDEALGQPQAWRPRLAPGGFHVSEVALLSSSSRLILELYSPFKR